jgi:hypothetical protein
LEVGAAFSIAVIGAREALAEVRGGRDETGVGFVLRE